MTSFKETYEYCEALIRTEIENTFSSSSTFSNEEKTITFSSINVTFD